MFNNAGGKLQTLAKVFCALGIIASVVMMIVLFGEDGTLGKHYDSSTRFIVGSVWLIVGSISSWITSLVIYAVGGAMENSEMARNESEIASRNAREAAETCKVLSEQMKQFTKAQKPAGTEVPEAKQPETKQPEGKKPEWKLPEWKQPEAEEPKEMPGLDLDDPELDISFHQVPKPVVCERCGKMFTGGYVAKNGSLPAIYICEKCYHALKGE